MAGEGRRERAGEGFARLFKKKTISFYFSPGKRTYVRTKLSLQFQGLRAPLEPILESATKHLSADTPGFQVRAWLRSLASSPAGTRCPGRFLIRPNRRERLGRKCPRAALARLENGVQTGLGTLSPGTAQAGPRCTRGNTQVGCHSDTHSTRHRGAGRIRNARPPSGGERLQVLT